MHQKADFKILLTSQMSLFAIQTNFILILELPSPPAPCLSLCPTPAEAPSLCPLASSAPLLSSIRYVRSVSPGVTAAQHAVVGTSPAAAPCSGGSRSPSRAYKTIYIKNVSFAVTKGGPW